MTKHTDFVVYAYSREDWTFYYIGKGRPQRPYSPHRTVKKPENREHIHILHSGLDNETAVKYEKALILFYGRKDLYPEWGILRNMTDGGEGTYGYIFTESHKEKISRSLRGISRTEEFKRNLSESRRGDKNPMYGRTISEEQKRIKSERWKGSRNPNWNRTYTEEERRKSSEQRKGEKGWFYGKNHTEETKRKISEKKSGKNHPRYRPHDWFHPVIGEVREKSCAEICKLYPEQKLHRSCLNKVAKGLQDNHKGWRAISSVM